MVGRPLPAARLARNSDPAKAIAKCRTDPDVVKTAPLVGCDPIGCPIAPPSVDLGGLRDEGACNIDPVAGVLERGEFFALDRGVRDDFEQLLVAPDVVLERRDVEIT